MNCPNCGSEIEDEIYTKSIECEYCGSTINFNDIDLDSEKIKFQKNINEISSLINLDNIKLATKKLNLMFESYSDNYKVWELCGRFEFIKIINKLNKTPKDNNGRDDSVLKIDIIKSFEKSFSKSLELVNENNKIEIINSLDNCLNDCTDALIKSKDIMFYYGLTENQYYADRRLEHWYILIEQLIELKYLISQYFNSIDFVRSVKILIKKYCFRNFIDGIYIHNYVIVDKLDRYGHRDRNEAIEFFWFVPLNDKYLKWYKNLYNEYKIELEEEENQKFNMKSEASLSSNESKCFIVTATLDNPNHLIIKELQFFRDEILLKNNIGVFAIRLYYKFGPIMANFISKSELLKFLSLHIIVLPIHKIVKIIFKRLYNGY